MELQPQTEENLKMLVQIRDDPSTTPAVRIQAIQTMQKIIEKAGGTATNAKPMEDQIMEMIRNKNARKKS